MNIGTKIKIEKIQKVCGFCVKNAQNCRCFAFKSGKALKDVAAPARLEAIKRRLRPLSVIFLKAQAFLRYGVRYIRHI